MKNTLYYGDNLEILRKKVKDESVDLCYIDPPFNSKRSYNQIYTNQGQEDRAQAQAFVDTWIWDDHAKDGFHQIISNHEGRFTEQIIDLVNGLRNVLKEGSLLAYLVSMALRVTEIQRVLKPNGTFYLHCDPTSSHYLKLVLDAIFCPHGGDFVNEIVWCYNVGGKGKKHWARKHDTLLFYAKTAEEFFFDGFAVGIKRETGTKSFGGIIGTDDTGRKYQDKLVKASGKYYRYYLDDPKIPEDWWVDINSIQSQSAERLGYPTQKPEALLERIIKATSRDGDVVLDAYCGCGTTIAVAQRLNRRWIGMDITYQSISLILKRIEKFFGKEVADSIVLNGIPKDMESAIALAHKKDDRLRKEFEKWAILTYTNNRAIINEKKGADHGIDGVAYILTAEAESVKMLLQVKSGNVSRGDIAKLRGDMDREGARLGTLITLENPTKPMRVEAQSDQPFTNPLTGDAVPKIAIVTVQEIVEGNVRLDSPVSLDALWKAKESVKSDQLPLFVPATAKTLRKPAATAIDEPAAEKKIGQS